MHKPIGDFWEGDHLWQEGAYGAIDVPSGPSMGRKIATDGLGGPSVA